MPLHGRSFGQQFRLLSRCLFPLSGFFFLLWAKYLLRKPMQWSRFCPSISCDERDPNARISFTNTYDLFTVRWAETTTTHKFLYSYRPFSQSNSLFNFSFYPGSDFLLRKKSLKVALVLSNFMPQITLFADYSYIKIKQFHYACRFSPKFLSELNAWNSIPMYYLILFQITRLQK